MDIERLLKEQQLKVTPQRKAILSVLVEADTVLSAQEIFSEVIKILPDINFSTIYRNLIQCYERYIMSYGSKTVVFFMSCVEKKYHHHVICKNCGVSIP